MSLTEIEQISESIEKLALQSLHFRSPPEVRKDVGLELVEVGDGLAACSRKDQSMLLNRVIGLGTSEEVTAQTLQKVAAIYQDRSIRSYFIHLYADTLSAGAEALLESPAFVEKRGWMKFHSGKPTGREAKTDLRVEKIGPEHAEAFGRIVCGAFDMDACSIPVLAGLVKDDRWHLFMSFEGDTPAGAGALFVPGRAGWLEWGATHPDFRRRGSQRAIMAARLKLAAELGCEWVFTETGEEVEGDPQHSYRNIMKSGFEETGLRLNYAPAPPDDISNTG